MTLQNTSGLSEFGSIISNNGVISVGIHSTKLLYRPWNFIYLYFQYEHALLTFNHHFDFSIIEIIIVKELGTSQTLFKKLIFISFSISLSLYLLWTYADFPLFYISSKLFIPLNFVIQSPHYTYSTFGGKTTSGLLHILLLYFSFPSYFYLSNNASAKSWFCSKN